MHCYAEVYNILNKEMSNSNLSYSYIQEHILYFDFKLLRKCTCEIVLLTLHVIPYNNGFPHMKFRNMLSGSKNRYFLDNLLRHVYCWDIMHLHLFI